VTNPHEIKDTPLYDQKGWCVLVHTNQHTLCLRLIGWEQHTPNKHNTQMKNEIVMTQNFMDFY
jgi:hypothetical protein